MLAAKRCELFVCSYDSVGDRRVLIVGELLVKYRVVEKNPLRLMRIRSATSLPSLRDFRGLLNRLCERAGRSLRPLMKNPVFAPRPSSMNSRLLSMTITPSTFATSRASTYAYPLLISSATRYSLLEPRSRLNPGEKAKKGYGSFCSRVSMRRAACNVQNISALRFAQRSGYARAQIGRASCRERV